MIGQTQTNYKKQFKWKIEQKIKTYIFQWKNRYEFPYHKYQYQKGYPNATYKIPATNEKEYLRNYITDSVEIELPKKEKVKIQLPKVSTIIKSAAVKIPIGTVIGKTKEMFNNWRKEEETSDQCGLYVHKNQVRAEAKKL